MAKLATIVPGTVRPERGREVPGRFETALAAGLPPGIERTYLLGAWTSVA